MFTSILYVSSIITLLQSALGIFLFGTEFLRTLINKNSQLQGASSNIEQLIAFLLFH